MNQKRVLNIFIRLILLFIVIIAVNNVAFNRPSILFEAEISTMSEKDYNQINSKDDIVNFKNITVKIKVDKSFGVISHTKIEGDSLQRNLENIDKITVYGFSTIENSNGKNHTEIASIQLEDISEDELIKIIGDCNYKVTWTSLWKKEKSELFFLKDHIK